MHSISSGVVCFKKICWIHAVLMFWQAKCVVIRKNKQMGIFIRGVKCGCVCVCERERRRRTWGNSSFQNCRFGEKKSNERHQQNPRKLLCWTFELFHCILFKRFRHQSVDLPFFFFFFACVLKLENKLNAFMCKACFVCSDWKWLHVFHFNSTQKRGEGC